MTVLEAINVTISDLLVKDYSESIKEMLSLIKSGLAYKVDDSRLMGAVIAIEIICNINFKDYVKTIPRVIYG